MEGSIDYTFDGRGSDTLRRGHSEGDILTVVSSPHRHVMGRDPTSEGETWIDFLRESPSNERPTPEWSHAATKRAVMVAADRKRRMTMQHADSARRRSASSISSAQAAHGRIPQSFSLTETDGLLARPRQPPGNRNNTGSIGRPPHHSAGMAEGQSHHDREIVLPRWQPDAEASKCPICGTIFSFWYRKHHCRKCGRVVCANCSPHRITIPRQFIVHPPTEIACVPRDDQEDLVPPRLGLRGEDSPRSQDFHLDPALGGGQEVRLCNPCVPDPNPAPPPAYPLPGQQGLRSFPRPDGFAVRPLPVPPLPGARAFSSHTQSAVIPVAARSSGQLGDTYQPEDLLPRDSNAAQQPTDESLVPDRYENLEEFLQRQRGNGFTVSLTACTSSEAVLTILQKFDPLVYINHPAMRAGVDATIAAGPAVNRRHSHAVQPVGAFPFPPRYSSMDSSRLSPSGNNVCLPKRMTSACLTMSQNHASGGTPPPRHRHHVSTSSVPSHPRYRSMLDSSTLLPQRALPQPQLREEDECPVCHCALPPKGADGSETAREVHIASCIDSHFSSSTPRSSHPPPAHLATAAVIPPGTATPSQAGATSSAAGPEAAGSGLTSAVTPRRRAGGMLVYHASEKDCVGEDGEGAQECVICFEEFAVGDEMGRLECLCKFHRVRCSLPLRSVDERATIEWLTGGQLDMHTTVVGY